MAAAASLPSVFSDPYFKNHVVRNGQVYILANRNLIDIGPRLYENGLIRTLEQDPADKDWVWRDRKGNEIHYNRYGQMQSYQDRNQVRVTVARNAVGNITQILDHFGNVVVTLTWEDIPGADLIKNKQGDDVFPQRPTQLQDNRGRTVVYQWSAQNQLESIAARGTLYFNSLVMS